MLCRLIESMRAQWRAVDQPIAALDEQILALARQDDTSQRLMAIPGVGPMLATALVAAVGSGADRVSHGAQPRQPGSASCRTSTAAAARPGFSGWPGTATASSRRLLVHAARSLKRVAIGRDDRLGRWLQGLEARAHANVATVALAAKLARFAWAIMTRHQAYRAAA